MQPKRSGRFDLRPIGVIRSTLKKRSEAPKQGSEGAPDAWIEIEPWALAGLHRMKVGDAVLVITWFHQVDRDVLQVHPRSDPKRALTGVFATRSPDRPTRWGFTHGFGAALARVDTLSKGSRTVRYLPALPCRQRAMGRTV